MSNVASQLKLPTAKAIIIFTISITWFTANKNIFTNGGRKIEIAQ
jgi:hypothetical protein